MIKKIIFSFSTILSIGNALAEPPVPSAAGAQAAISAPRLADAPVEMPLTPVKVGAKVGYTIQHYAIFPYVQPGYKADAPFPKDDFLKKKSVLSDETERLRTLYSAYSSTRKFEDIQSTFSNAFLTSLKEKGVEFSVADVDVLPSPRFGIVYQSKHGKLANTVFALDGIQGGAKHDLKDDSYKLFAGVYLNEITPEKKGQYRKYIGVEGESISLKELMDPDMSKLIVKTGDLAKQLAKNIVTTLVVE